ncbi:hypothetical protein [Umezawaea sp. NPDC059074]|uniref:hypothetical protein n=1 Tax=Umezawaea sp. NPDC059074 TaxID=3346716 RepID=UPI00368B7DB6
MGHLREVLALLNQAATDGRIDLAVTDRAPCSATPVGPPEYLDLLTEHGSLSVHREFAGETLRFVVVDEKGAAELNRGLVHVRRGALSTAHLLGFAEAGDDAAWCFDITDDAFPVYYVHLQEPKARRVDTGEWENPADATPDFPSFAVWLDVMAAAFTSPQPPRWFPYLGEPGLTFT